MVAEKLQTFARRSNQSCDDERPNDTMKQQTTDKTFAQKKRSSKNPFYGRGGDEEQGPKKSIYD